MKNNDLIHLKIDYVNALDSKKDLLSSEKNLMMMAKAMHSYGNLRKKELKKRVTLARKSREMISLLKKIRTEMPQVHSPAVGRKHFFHEPKFQKEIPEKKKKQSKNENHIETQLEEIQRKLRDIGK